MLSSTLGLESFSFSEFDNASVSNNVLSLKHTLRLPEWGLIPASVSKYNTVTLSSLSLQLWNYIPLRFQTQMVIHFPQHSLQDWMSTRLKARMIFYEYHRSTAECVNVEVYLVYKITCSVNSSLILVIENIDLMTRFWRRLNSVWKKELIIIKRVN